MLSRRITTIWIAAFVALVSAPAAAQQPGPPDDETGDDAPEDTREAEEAEETDPPEESGGLSENEITVWVLEGDSTTRRGKLREALGEALAGQPGKHLLNKSAVESHIAQRSSKLHGCFTGVSDCASPRGLVFDALELTSMVRVKIADGAASWQLVDGRGEVVREDDVEAGSPRELAFGLVRDIFDATGTIAFETRPEAASVSIDSEEVGTTPLRYRLPIGRHEYVIRHPDHEPAEGTVEVTSGSARVIRHNLTPLPGTLVVRDAPEGARVLVNDIERGRAGELIDLPPGNYTVEVRAKGYEPMRDAITLQPGAVVKRSAPLQEKNPFLRDIPTDDIALNRYMVRLGYEHGFQRATFQDARGVSNSGFELKSLRDEDGNLPTGGVARRNLSTNGLRIDFTYSWRNFALVLLSMTYLSSTLDWPAVVTAPGGVEVPITVTRARRFQVRPFQLMYRYFYKNFVPFIDGGIGIDFTTLDVAGTDLGDVEKLRNTEAFWTLAIGAQYYFTENIFVLGRYSLQSYLEDSFKPDHQIGLGVGAAFPNLFGLDTEPPETL